MDSAHQQQQDDHHTRTAIALLDSVYGPVDAPDFPRPMPKSEAGLCCDGHHRRYLWTDAFAVLAYTSLAERLQEKQEHTPSPQQDSSDKYRQAAHKLVDVVHQCLGTPASITSSKNMSKMRVDDSSPTGYVGLRIGKTESRPVTDYGMRYDGQYWHYIDKWLLALARLGRVADGIGIAKSCFPYFYDDNSAGGGGGMRWKLSVDATPPPDLERAYPNDDTLTALIVFSILEQQQRRLLMNVKNNSGANDSDKKKLVSSSLENEITTLQSSLQGYKPRVTDDPLGWGMEAIFDQFIDGHPRRQALVSLQSSALHPSHLYSLPFRSYGALMGARTMIKKTDDGQADGINTNVDQLTQLSIQYQQTVIASSKQEEEEHSSINRVMLAMCLLCPGGALQKRPDDPIIRLQ